MAEKNKADAPQYYPGALTVAGSDSGGGAGIEADLRTFNAFGAFGCAALTAVTAQNPAAVTRVDLIPPEGVAAQLEAVLSKIRIGGAKTGMLGSAAIVEAVHSVLKKYRIKLICDPVMISTSGKSLLDEDGVKKLRQLLLPLSSWVTPNIPEAAMLTGRRCGCRNEYLDTAKALYELCGANVLLKGGHDEKSSTAEDYVCYEGELFTIQTPRLQLPPYSTHGTGCTLSAAMTALSALGFDWQEMLTEARAFVFGSLRENVLIGKGIHAMYPPVEDSLELVKFKKVPSGGKKEKK